MINYMLVTLSASRCLGDRLITAALPDDFQKLAEDKLDKRGKRKKNCFECDKIPQKCWFMHAQFAGKSLVSCRLSAFSLLRLFISYFYGYSIFFFPSF